MYRVSTIVFGIMDNVCVWKKSVLGQFLNFLSQDTSKNPQNIKAIGSDLFKRAQSLVKNVELDLDAPLSEEDE